MDKSALKWFIGVLVMGLSSMAMEFGECFTSPMCVVNHNNVGMVMADGKSLNMKYNTVVKRGTQYQIARVTFPKPVDMSGKTLQFHLDAMGGSEESILCVAVRFYNQPDEAKGAKDGETCLSFMHWADNSLDTEQDISLHPDWCMPMTFHYQTELCGGVMPTHVKTCDIFIGSVTPNVEISVALSKFRMIDQKYDHVPKRETLFTIPWSRVPVYADKPAKVRHPVGTIKAEDVARARENYKRHEWARKSALGLKNWGWEWMERDEEAIKFWIPEDDAWFKCLCPNCDTQPEFAWRGKDVLQPDGLHIKCTKCGMVFPNDQYPENSTYTITTVHGKTKTIKYYHGKDQIAQGENYGPRYHLTGEVNRLRLLHVGSIFALAQWYAISGEVECAEKVRQVLLRLAEVYPNYSVKYRATAYETPRDRYMGGKIAAWKFTDSTLLPNVLDAYSLTYNSGVYSDEDKVKIENGLAREIKWLYTAWPPTKDSCSNAVPAHMRVCAMAAAVLGDHELMDWVMKGSEGFPAFVRKYYERDGHWHEHTPSYGGMATSPIVSLVRVLHGYRDAEDYTGEDRYNGLDAFKLIPELDLVFTGYAAGVLPTLTYPATNDSAANTAPSLIWLQLAVDKAPNERNKALLQYISGRYGDRAAPGQNALFYRDPDATPGDVSVVPEAAAQARIFPGGGWVMLRRPESFRDSCAMVLTTGHKSHDHNCTLGLTYSDFGRDASSDLGYLSAWHPYANWLRTPLAHNLVVVDGKPQEGRRMGYNELFAGTGSIVASRTAGKQIYRPVTAYERTVFNMPLYGGKRQYIADFFHVKGGDSHLWVFHADGQGYFPPAEIKMAPSSETELDAYAAGSKWLENIEAGILPKGTHLFAWKQVGENASGKLVTNSEGSYLNGRQKDGLTTRSFILSEADAPIFHAEGLGLRTQATPYDKPKMHIAMVKRPGPENIFAHVIECDKGTPLVKEAQLLEAKQASAKAIKVVTSEGTDYLAIGNGELRIEGLPDFRMNARSAVVRLDANGALKALWVEGGTVAWGDKSLTASPMISGMVEEVTPHEITINVANWPSDLNVKGMYFSVLNQYDGAYRMISASQIAPNRVRIALDPYEVNRIIVSQTIRLFPYAERNYAK